MGVSRLVGMHHLHCTSTGTVLMVLFQTSNMFNVTLAESVGGKLPFI